VFAGWPPPGKPGNPEKVGEFISRQGKVGENVFLSKVSCDTRMMIHSRT